MLTLKGDFRKIAKVRIGLQWMRRSLRQITQVVGDAALDELRTGIAEGRAPDGAAWPATSEGRKALQGGMAASWTLTVNGLRASLRTSHDGAGMHQRGGVIVAKRKGTGRDGAGRFTRGRRGVLAFVVGGRKVFARKVKIPQRRMTPQTGTLERWEPRVAHVVQDHLSRRIGL